VDRCENRGNRLDRGQVVCLKRFTSIRLVIDLLLTLFLLKKLVDLLLALFFLVHVITWTLPLNLKPVRRPRGRHVKVVGSWLHFAITAEVQENIHREREVAEGSQVTSITCSFPQPKRPPP